MAHSPRALKNIKNPWKNNMNSFKFNEKDAKNIAKLGKVYVPDVRLAKLTEILNKLYELVMQNYEMEAHFREFIRHNGAVMQQHKSILNKSGADYNMEDLFAMQIWIGLMFQYLDSSSANR